MKAPWKGARPGSTPSALNWRHRQPASHPRLLCLRNLGLFLITDLLGLLGFFVVVAVGFFCFVLLFVFLPVL